MIFNTAPPKKTNEEEIKNTQLIKEVNEPAQDMVKKNDIDIPMVWNSLTEQLKGQEDYLLFAYYLYLTDLEEIDDSDKEFLKFNYRVCFCDDARLTNGTVIRETRLEQLYHCDAFTGVVYDAIYILKDDIPKAFYNRCKYCRGHNPGAYRICPYVLCGIIMYISSKEGRPVKEYFERLLGRVRIPFGNTYSDKKPDIDVEEIRGIDSKSAHGAYILIRDGFFRARMNNGYVLYSYINIWQQNDHSILFDKIIDFWKSDDGMYSYRENPDNLFGRIMQTKPLGNYRQDPVLLAAYFTYLAGKHSCNPEDIAYATAVRTTTAGLTIPQNYKHAVYFDMINELSLNPGDKEDLCKLINYIIIRYKRTNAPLLPVQMIITSSDEDSIKKLEYVIDNALWYFDYYINKKTNKTVRKNIAQTTTGELVKIINEAAVGTTLILNQFDLMDKDPRFDENYYSLVNAIEEKRDRVTIIAVSERYKMDVFLQGKKELAKCFSRRYDLLEPDGKIIYKKLIEKLSQSLEITPEADLSLALYIGKAYKPSAMEGSVFIQRTYEDIIFNHFNDINRVSDQLEKKDIPYIKPPRKEEEIFEELNKLIGLRNVKEELRRVYELVKFTMKTQKEINNRVNMHMVFNGNAGTGKTTVARLVAEILYSIGFIKENKLVICSAKDLVGEYLGQTTPKTARRCEEAYNGVLFIDEAYQLNPYSTQSGDPYKEECIAELIQQMENNRNRLVVIFAGYTDEMKAFIERANSGLKSRIGTTIDFPDYSVDELMEIFGMLLSQDKMSADDTALFKARGILEKAAASGKGFGNARYVRNLYERSIMQHASSTSNLSKDDPGLYRMHAEDIIIPDNTGSV